MNINQYGFNKGHQNMFEAKPRGLADKLTDDVKYIYLYVYIWNFKL